MEIEQAPEDRDPGTSLPDPVPPPPPRRTDEWTMSVAVGIMQLAGLSSIGAGAIHAGAAGMHAEHTTLARLFVSVAVAQIAVGMLALVKGGRLAAVLTTAVNLGAVAAWGTTRLWGISWINGLEEAEAAQFTDTACAALGAIAAVAAVVALARRATAVSTVRLGVPAMSVGAVALAAMLVGANHVHSHDQMADATGNVGTGTETVSAAGVSPVSAAEVSSDGHNHNHNHDHESGAASGAGAPGELVSAAASDWPRPWDPAQPIDLSGVEGVTPEQELRATALIEQTLQELPAFADVETAFAAGYRSIGDSVTGFEHYIRYDLIDDGVWLDATEPETLVYRVDGEERTLVSAMYLAPKMAVDDPELVEYGGPLMQWHVHDNLCWRGGEDGPKVAAVTDADGNCPEGTVRAGGENPMVHVWIVPHECGPFAALEGNGAGQTAAAAGERTDQCAHHHGGGPDGHGQEAEVSALSASGEGEAAAAEMSGSVPYDPERPIDLGGTPGVTPQQQAFAENLVSATIVDLPQWADTATAEEAGFHSIGDAATGFEHYVQWDWINDDVWLDPDQPESLVYRIEADGSKTLVSAMYMLPDTVELEDIADVGGALMQWHVHSDLCFDVGDPEAPRVGGLTDAAGRCTEPLVKLGEAPMIHVWIVPHECGPFAALEGVGAGQVAAGEEHYCDHDHGSHD
jgi:hypothetical protein